MSCLKSFFFLVLSLWNPVCFYNDSTLQLRLVSFQVLTMESDNADLAHSRCSRGVLEHINQGGIHD